MADPAPPGLTLPADRMLAAIDYVEQAVTFVNNAIGLQFAQPAQTPAESAQRVAVVTREAVRRLHRWWFSLPDADLREAGGHIMLNFCEKILEQGAAGVQVIRQFSKSPPGDPPAPGAS